MFKKKLFKKLFSSFFAVLLTLCLCSCSGNSGAVYADRLNEGTYSIEVESSSSMFRIIDCKLTVSEGKMTAVMTLSGKGYEKIFPGTISEAEAADDDSCSYFVVNEAEQYTYQMPVEVLDTEIPCAAFSKKKQQWYDRMLVFKSASLPKTAFRTDMMPIVLIGAVIVVVIAVAIIIAVKLKRKGKEE